MLCGVAHSPRVYEVLGSGPTIEAERRRKGLGGPFCEHGTELRLLRNTESDIWGHGISRSALARAHLHNVTEQQRKSALLLNIVVHAVMLISYGVVFCLLRLDGLL